MCVVSALATRCGSRHGVRAHGQPLQPVEGTAVARRHPRPPQRRRRQQVEQLPVDGEAQARLREVRRAVVGAAPPASSSFGEQREADNIFTLERNPHHRPPRH
jgi:hypothetical protein